MQGIADPLSARGLVLLPSGQDPIVLCAVDWVGIANGALDEWRAGLADAAGTSADRVAVHTLHQHDAPFADTTTEDLLSAVGLSERMFSPRFAAEAIERTATALSEALSEGRTVTHLSFGKALVEQVASNRRILGPDGKVAQTRWTACTDPALQAEPEGTIDPYARVIGLWDDEEAVVVLSYYATHPQSFYRTGLVSTDFVGLARKNREDATGQLPHLHFNGASGNVGAGKYNDGRPENRMILAGRLSEGIRKAWEDSERIPLEDAMIHWDALPVDLPPRIELNAADLERVLSDPSADDGQRMQAARELAWLKRCEAGTPIHVSRLQLGPVSLLHLPGELFVEYQLAAQEMAAEQFVCVAAYGDYGPGYIGTAEAYPQGGYETDLYVSRTAPEVEAVLLEATGQLLTSKK
jgi:hypothetical protein